MCKSYGYRVRFYSCDGSEYLSIIDSDDDLGDEIETISISSDEGDGANWHTWINSPPLRNDVNWGWNDDDEDNELLVSVITIHTVGGGGNDDDNNDGPHAIFNYLNLTPGNGFDANDNAFDNDDPNHFFLDAAERAWLDAQNNVEFSNVANMDIRVFFHEFLKKKVVPIRSAVTFWSWELFFCRKKKQLVALPATKTWIII